MIYRIQSLYLLFAIIALLILTFGVDIYHATVHEAGQYEMIAHSNVMGVQKDILVKGELTDQSVQYLRDQTGKVDVQEGMTNVSIKKSPYYAFTILMTIFLISVLVNFKKLKKQFALAKVSIIFNFILFGLALYMYYGLQNEISQGTNPQYIAIQLELGFYCICITFAFSVLALLGIRRDYKLVQSINRLR